MNGWKSGFGLGMGAMIGIASGIMLLVFSCCAGCFGLALVGAIMDGNSASASAARISRERPVRAAELPPARNEPEARIVRINQDAVAGDIRWKVLAADDLGNSLRSENEFIDPISTGGRFVKVRFEMENRGGDVVHFSDVNLVDAKSRKFEDHSDAGIWYVDDQEHCIFEKLNPNITRTCTMIFEVPVDATGLKFQAGDLDMFGSEEVLIDLGL